MKVGFLGNMNNGPFSIVRYLRARGVDAELMIYDGEFEHFHPSADSFDDSYRAYTRNLDWGSPGRFRATSKAQILKDIAPYDVLLGNGPAPAYLDKVGRALDVMVPYGDDLWNQTFYRLAGPRYLPNILDAVYHQRRGIGRSRVISLIPVDSALEAQYRKYRGNAVRWEEGLLPVHGPTYAPEQVRAMADRTRWWREFRELRERYEFMVVSPVRHVWTQSGNIDDKGTDVLIRGWAAFRKTLPNIRAVLVMLEYGVDVAASKQLIEELGVADSVAWLPKMYRKDLMVGLNLADIVCGYFGPSWITGGVLTEAMAVEKPILGWRDDSLYRDFAPGLYPMLKARAPEEIAQHLVDTHADPERLREMGRQAREWYETKIVAPWLDKFDRYLEACSSRGPAV
jgi:glycosyltransferase involved in cell wall biosynthesis